jgi:hypothetical protein
MPAILIEPSDTRKIVHVPGSRCAWGSKKNGRKFENIVIQELYTVDQGATFHPSMSPMSDAQRQRGTLNRRASIETAAIAAVMDAALGLAEKYGGRCENPAPPVESKLVTRKRAAKREEDQEAAMGDFSEFNSSPASSPQPDPPDDAYSDRDNNPDSF